MSHHLLKEYQTDIFKNHDNTSDNNTSDNGVTPEVKRNTRE